MQGVIWDRRTRSLRAVAQLHKARRLKPYVGFRRRAKGKSPQSSHQLAGRMGAPLTLDSTAWPSRQGYCREPRCWSERKAFVQVERVGPRDAPWAFFAATVEIPLELSPRWKNTTSGVEQSPVDTALQKQCYWRCQQELFCDRASKETTTTKSGSQGPGLQGPKIRKNKKGMLRMAGRVNKAKCPQ